jgi:anti-sigma regulatory factor (Ser/Thr protein kinase)
MRHSLTSWLELTDATAVVRNAVLLATHEAAANAMAHGEPESPVNISASRDAAGGFTVEVTNLGGWKEPEPGNVGRGLAVMSELMSEVAIQTRTSVRMLSG